MKKENLQSLIYDAAQSGKTLLLTVFICCIVYAGIVLLIGNTLLPEKAAGSLLRDAQGRVSGSRLIAQSFTRPEYFWPRPSAVDYNASASGGSNLSPANPALSLRIKRSLSELESKDNQPVPADLVMASGSGLDPHISITGAMFQTERVAKARSTDTSVVIELIRQSAKATLPGQTALINVLELNILLDQKLPLKKQPTALQR